MFYLLRQVSSQSEAPMKSLPLRTRQPAQTDLFDSVQLPLPRARLEQVHDQLVALLSQLLWEVVDNADATRSPENSDEQDQP
ncbi:copper oxidase (laccase) domain-containing protein [Paraburkholderia sp. JPY465]|uniref:hypothetical protein n=1 Tax=Paraburkholderia sp. JPY465 TaxID=3042285 RepID=UPI003D1F583D